MRDNTSIFIIKILSTLLLGCFICTSLFSQSLSISNEKETIDLSNKEYFEIHLCRTPENLKACKKGAILKGNLIRVTEDSLHFLAFDHETYSRNSDDIKISHVYKSKKGIIPIVIPKNSAMSVRAFRSKKESKWRNTLGGVGGSIAAAGVITALGSLFIRSKSDRKNLALAGGSMFLGGITLGISSTVKSHCLCKACDGWKVE